MTELPKGYRYREPPLPGTHCEYKRSARTAVVTLQTRDASRSRMLTQCLCDAHCDLVINKILAEIDAEANTPESFREKRGETLMEIEQITAFLEGRGAFPVAGFVGMEGMSQAEVRKLAARHLVALHEDIEIIDEMLEYLRKGRPLW
jgi:hypothetical protein